MVPQRRRCGRLRGSADDSRASCQVCHRLQQRPAACHASRRDASQTQGTLPCTARLSRRRTARQLAPDRRSGSPRRHPDCSSPSSICVTRRYHGTTNSQHNTAISNCNRGIQKPDPNPDPCGIRTSPVSVIGDRVEGSHREPLYNVFSKYI